jgi:tetratricopeptide (TPR) repeat protein
MKDHLEKQPDQTQKLDSGPGAGQSSQFDVIRDFLGADGRRNTCIPQSRLFKDYISYTYVGPDIPPQHAEETLSTSFRHDAPGQKLPMSALRLLEMRGNDDELLRQAANHYELGKMSEKTDKDSAQGQYKQAERWLKCALDNCTEEPKPDGHKIELIAHGLAQVYKMQGRYGDAEEVYRNIIDHYADKHQLDNIKVGASIKGGELYRTITDHYAHEHQPDDLKIGAAMKGLAKVYEMQGKYKEAKEFVKSALLICKEMFGNNDPRTAWVMKNLATIYEKMEKPAKAKTLLHEYVLPIFEKKLGENDLKTENVRKKLTDLPVKPGQDLVITRGTQRLIAESWVNTILPRIKYHKRLPDICDPKLFNDKVLHRKLFDRRPIHTQFSDKLAVRQYVKDRIGEQYLPELYHLVDPHYREDKLKQQTNNTNLPSEMQHSAGLTSEITRSGVAPENVSQFESISTDPSSIPFEKLPDKFVIKCTQGSDSRQVRIVTDKSTVNESEIIEECNKWLNNDHHKKGGSWHHKYTKRRIIIEEYINDGKGEVAPYDYKLFTYNGVTQAIQVNVSPFERDFYDTQWNKLPMTINPFKSLLTSLPRPPHLEQMLELAQQLGKGIDFVRIDLYDTPEKVFFGEITPTPFSGRMAFAPPMYDRIFGEPWTEVYNKCSIPKLPPSHEVCQILRQITCGMHKLALEGQRNSEASQLKRKESGFDGQPKKRLREEGLP